MIIHLDFQAINIQNKRFKAGYYEAPLFVSNLELAFNDLYPWKIE